MKKINIVPAIVFLFLMPLTNLNAQTKDYTFTISDVAPKTVEPIPYSAQAASEAVQTLNNGNKIKRATKELIFADGKGRVRRESENVFNNKTQKSISIRDPLAGFEYFLNPITKTAYRLPIKTFSPASQKVSSPPSGYSTKSEPLGKKIIEGFETTGMRSVTTIAPGTIGNEQPLEMISETWFSPELKTIIFTRRSDPQTGDYTYEMKNIKRETPDASLFIVPADYKILDQGSVSDRFFTVETTQ
jgi:hypothetical protein